jgi:hypothetical protein
MFYLWNNDDEDEGSIAAQWLVFAENLATERPHGDDPLELTGWIDDVVERFSDSFDLCDILLPKLEELT